MVGNVKHRMPTCSHESGVHTWDTVAILLQDFNMAKRQSRPQTNKNNTHKMLGKHYGKHETDYSGVGRLA
jgi:hypothetical protein